MRTGVLWVSTAIALVASSACKTSGNGAALKSEEAPAEAEYLGEYRGPVKDFCVPSFIDPVKGNTTTVRQLRDDRRDLQQWRSAFIQGVADESIIPSRDLRPGVVSNGLGFPKITTVMAIDNLANSLWYGKTMRTDGGETVLLNRFLSGNTEEALKLLSAKVVVDQTSRWNGLDSNQAPVILLDYSQTSVVDPRIRLGSINSTPVPVIKAIRDEIRLVCQTTQNGVRRRLYLGPTFLIPELFTTSTGKLLARQYERDPILWFSLEFNDRLEDIEPAAGQY